MYNLTPHFIHRIDQRTAQVSNLDYLGHDQAVLFMAERAMEQISMDPMIVADLLTIAIDRLVSKDQLKDLES